jgi:hypothetical protein
MALKWSKNGNNFKKRTMVLSGVFRRNRKILFQPGSQKVGLKINISKLKDLCVNSNTIEAFKIGEEAIETVDDFTNVDTKS